MGIPNYRERLRLNYVPQLFYNNGSIKKQHEFKREYDLYQNSYFLWVQLIDSIPEKWKLIIKKHSRKRLENYDFRRININRIIFYIDFKGIK